MRRYSITTSIKISVVVLCVILVCLFVQWNMLQRWNFLIRTFSQTGSENRSTFMQNISGSENSTGITSTIGITTGILPQKRNVHRLLGKPRDTVGFLTIGLCTVPRRNESYLLQTLTSLISNMAVKERESVVIVVFLSSDNATWIQEMLSTIVNGFADDIENGLLHVIQPDPSIYPDFSIITKRTFGDTLQRVHWRTKQNIDFAYLFSYCSNISQYYLHVEDDVLAVPGFIPSIRYSIQTHSNPTWFCMEFFNQGFIGKLFRSSDLQLIKKFLLMFKVEQPGDMLLPYLWQIMTQKRVVKGTRMLFRHIGKVSSLDGKMFNLETGTVYINPP